MPSATRVRAKFGDEVLAQVRSLEGQPAYRANIFLKVALIEDAMSGAAELQIIPRFAPDLVAE
jgi:hypothetical protein